MSETEGVTPAEERALSLLLRCNTVLGNMAWEREGFWNSLFGRRWVISDEPLRADAKGLLPEIEKVMADANERAKAAFRSSFMAKDN